MNYDAALTRYTPFALAILRILCGVLLLEHGCQKLLGFPPPNGGAGPEAFTLMWFAGLIELFGGALIAVGLFTRPAAFVASGFTAAAYFIAHAPRSFFPTLNGGDAAILFCFVFLFLVVAGPGRWSVDGAIRRRA